MRSIRLLVLAVLVVVLALSSTQSAYAGQVSFEKICKPNDSAGAVFRFAVTIHRGGPAVQHEEDVECDFRDDSIGEPSGTYVFTELVSENPPGWVLRDIVCERISGDGDTWWEIEGASVTIYHDSVDVVVCSFTNSRAGPVGGAVVPANPFAILASWLAVVGLVGCIGTVVVVVRKRQS